MFGGWSLCRITQDAELNRERESERERERARERERETERERVLPDGYSLFTSQSFKEKLKIVFALITSALMTLRTDHHSCHLFLCVA